MLHTGSRQNSATFFVFVACHYATVQCDLCIGAERLSVTSHYHVKTRGRPKPFLSVSARDLRIRNFRSNRISNRIGGYDLNSNRIGG